MKGEHGRPKRDNSEYLLILPRTCVANPNSHFGDKNVDYLIFKKALFLLTQYSEMSHGDQIIQA